MVETSQNNEDTWYRAIGHYDAELKSKFNL